MNFVTESLSSTSANNSKTQTKKILLNSSILENETSSSSTSSTDELSFSEIIFFVMQAKHFILYGVLFGLLCAYIFFLCSSPMYTSKIPLSIDIRTLPAITEQRLVVEDYNSALATPEIFGIALDTIINNSKEFATAINNAGITKENIITQQVWRESSKRSSTIPIKLAAGIGASEFFIETNFPVKGLNETIPENVVAAINTAGKAYNQAILEQRKIAAIGSEKELLESYAALQEKLEPVLAKKINKELDIRASLSQIELQLEQEIAAAKLSTKIPNSNEVLVDFDNFANLNAKLTHFFISEKQFIRIMRLKAALVSANKISPEKHEALNNTLFEIQKKAQLLNNEYVPVLSSLQLMQAQISEAQKEVLIPVDKKTMNLPLFKKASFLSADIQNKRSWESSNTSIIIYLTVGIIMGVSMGLFIFLLKNYSKIYKIQRSGSH